jgi:hypothetical protein
MRTRIAWFFVLLLPFVTLDICYSQSLTPTVPQVDSAVKGPTETEKQQMLDSCKRSYDRLQRENDDLMSKIDAAAQGYNEYYYGTYAPEVAKIRLDGFRWQVQASNILIWVVVVVCLSGIVFSGYQLWRATAPGLGGSADKSDPLAANVELSWQNVRVTSSVVGLVVLVISVAYLYLFLKEVYHIDAAQEAAVITKATPEPTPDSAAK